MLYITVNTTQCIMYAKPSLQLIAGVTGVGGIAKRLIFIGISLCTTSHDTVQVKQTELRFKMYS